MSGPFATAKDAEKSRNLFIRVQKKQDAARKAAIEARGLTFRPFSPPAEDIYRIEQQPTGYIVVLDDPSL